MRLFVCVSVDLATCEFKGLVSFPHTSNTVVKQAQDNHIINAYSKMEKTRSYKDDTGT